MVGWLALSKERFWGPRWSIEEIVGLPVLKVEVACPAGLSGRTAARRVRRGCALLVRRGTRRVLTAADFPFWPLLENCGLRNVDPLPFCRAVAGELALALLDRRGVPAGEGAVCLRAERVDRDVFRCASVLCPRVRTLVLDIPKGGASLAAWLRDEYGAASIAAGDADVTVAFSEGEGDLRLWGAPGLDGLLPRPPEGAFPAELEPLALAALLWEEERLGRNKMEFA